MTLIISYSPTFQKLYRKLPNNIQLLAEQRELIFTQNPFDPRLHTHKLRGEHAGFWSFSINYHYRIIFEFVTAQQIYFHTTGTHEIYK